MVYFDVPKYVFDDMTHKVRETLSIDRKKRPTCDSYDLTRLLPPRKENDILLRAIDVVVLQEEDLVNSIFLQRAEFDEDTDRPC